MSAKLDLTPCEIEALTHFLAERYELWMTHAQGFGVREPEVITEKLTAAYHAAIQKLNTNPVARRKTPTRATTRVKVFAH